MSHSAVTPAVPDPCRGGNSGGQGARLEKAPPVVTLQGGQSAGGQKGGG